MSGYAEIIEAAGYWLLNNHTPTVKPWYTTRQTDNGTPKFVVLHTAENVPDFAPPDHGAEAVATYGASTSRASWHATVDSDSIVPMLPDLYTAWHVRGYNTGGLGVEMATQAHRWATDLIDNPTWVDRMLDNAATVVAYWCSTWDIPVRLVTAGSVDRAVYGITYHSYLDPGRRTDPGDKFPYEILATKVEDKMAQFDETQAAFLADLADRAAAAGLKAGHVAVDPSQNFEAMAEVFPTMAHKGDQTGLKNALVALLGRVDALESELATVGPHTHPATTTIGEV